MLDFFLDRQRCGDPLQPLFKIEYLVLKKSFEKAQETCGLQAVKYVVYQARHGGPSHERRHKLRLLAEVKQRGRWVGDSSMRRYEAHARVQQEEGKESLGVQLRAASAATTLDKLFHDATLRRLIDVLPTSKGRRSSSSSQGVPGSLVRLPSTGSTARPGTSSTALVQTSSL